MQLRKPKTPRRQTTTKTLNWRLPEKQVNPPPYFLHDSHERHGCAHSFYLPESIPSQIYLTIELKELYRKRQLNSEITKSFKCLINYWRTSYKKLQAEDNLESKLVTTIFAGLRCMTQTSRLWALQATKLLYPCRREELGTSGQRRIEWAPWPYLYKIWAHILRK